MTNTENDKDKHHIETEVKLVSGAIMAYFPPHDKWN
jgi:hypothetical protein